MTKYYLILLAFASQLMFSQVSISKNRLVKDGKTYRMSEYKDVFTNEEAQLLFKKSRTNNTVGNILGFTAGLAIGTGLTHVIINSGKKTVQTPYGSYTVKNDNSVAWLITGIGGGLVVAGIPFAIGAKKNAEKAIMIENGNTSAFKPYFKFESTGTALALSYNF